MESLRFGFLAVILTSMSPCLSYNLEEKLPLFKYGVEDSKFGFSVALHRITDERVGVSGTLMVAGAPTAAAIGTPDIGRMPINPGGVFYCPVATNRADCKRVRMDEGGDGIDETTNVTQVKSNQWLGVSLKSQGPGQYLITCAHRYTEQFNLGTANEKERVCGKCFLLKYGSSGRIEEVPSNSPDLPFEFESSLCDKYKRRPALLDYKTRYGKSQAGTSISLHSGQYVLGAPGTWAWTGALFDFTIPSAGAVDSGMVETPKCYSRDRQKNEFGSWHCSKIPVRRDSLMGFSVATSSAVNTDSDRFFYAAGAPVGNHTGAVVFFEKSTADNGLEVLLPDREKTVLGEKVGSSFGFSVALTDVNGDDLDDLLVGAPQYYTYTPNLKIGGALYIYLNEPDKEFNDIKPKRIFGPLESYFGHSIAPLGDLDQDGFNDFAVGAPYENENGTVHIFRGGVDGPVKSQEIRGSNYGFVRKDFKEIVGFGASLSGSVDTDNNRYPDLLIGTFSDSIALLRSRPIITVTSSLDVGTEELNLERKTCAFGGQSYTCFTLQYCLSYRARHANYPAGVALKYSIRIDNIRQQRGESARLHFDSPSGDSTLETDITLPRADETVCPGNTHDIYFDDDVDDRLTNIEVKFEFELKLPEIKMERQDAPVFNLIKDPILDADVDNQKSALVRIKNTCGDDGCQSGLKFTADMPKEIYIGGNKHALLIVNVTNDGEEAHQAFVDIYLPPGVDFVESTVRNMSTPGMSCYPTPSGLSFFIKCNLGNPYKEGAKDTIEILLSTGRVESTTKTIDVRIEGHTTSVNPEIPPVALQAQVIVELSLSLTWFSKPDQVRYGKRTILGESGMKTTEDIGPMIEYTFDVQNLGVASASGVTLDIQLPYEIYNGKWLLYLVSSDVQEGAGVPAGTCNSTFINVLQLEPTLSVTSSKSSSRRKRSASSSPAFQVLPKAEASSSGNGYVGKIDLSCERKSGNYKPLAMCQSIKCDMDEIPSDSTTSVVMQVHLWEATFIEEFKSAELISIHTKVQLTSENQNVRIKSGRTSGVVETTVDHDDFREDVADSFPWWYILIGVIILLIIYILIMVFLCRCGFFKRKKYSRENEDDGVLVEEEDNEEKKRDEDKI